ncbi:MAG: MATE family efflux transporter [Pseudonocardiaceae bacterium]
MTSPGPARDRAASRATPPDAARRPRPLAELWRITYPLVLTSFAQVAITIVDTALLGRYSTTALAAVALAAPVYLVAIMVVRGWATAAQIIVARRFGAHDHDAVATVTAVGLVAAVLTGMALGALLLGFAPTILELLGGGPAVADAGAGYLRILAAAVPFAAATFLLQGAYAGLGATRVAMVMMLLVNIVNLLLGLVLIFGCGLGIVGAGLAGLLSTAVGAGYLLWYGRRRTGERPLLRRRDLNQWQTAMPTLWRLAWPEAALLFIGYVDEVVLIGFVAQLGGLTLGAQRLLDSLILVVFTVLTACGTGVSIAVGQRLGAGEPGAARAYQRAGLGLAAALAAVPAIPALLLPTAIYSLLSPDRAVVGVAADATHLAILSLVPLLFALNLTGVLRAAGDNRTIVKAMIVGDYAVLVPLAWLLGVHLGWGLNGIYAAWTGFSLLVLAMVFRRYRTGAWQTSSV